MARTSRPKRHSRRSGKSPGSTLPLPTERLHRLFDAIERELKQMRSSAKLLQSDPGRYKPQMENLSHSAGLVQNYAKVIIRTIGAE